MPFVVISIVAALFLALPLVVTIPMSFSAIPSFQFPPTSYSFRYYQEYFTDPDWIDVTYNSFLIAALTTVLTLAIVIPSAMGIVRYRSRLGKQVNILVMLPMMMPHVVSALAFYSFLSQIGMNGSILGMVLAHTTLAIPVSFLVIAALMKGFDYNLERAAMSSGAGPYRTFFYVTFPVLRPGILVAALFAFLSSFNEAVVSIFIAGRNASTLPKKMFESIRLDTDPTLAVVSTLLTLSVFVCILFYAYVNYRKRG
jgi:putative spermidine/putrescine transport system permease protein